MSALIRGGSARAAEPDGGIPTLLHTWRPRTCRTLGGEWSKHWRLRKAGRRFLPHEGNQARRRFVAMVLA